MHPTPLIITSSLIVIFTLLAYPVLTTIKPEAQEPGWAVAQVITAVKVAFFVSLLPLFLFLNEGAETIITT